MSAPTPAAEWLMSAYDETWHAFPSAQVSDQKRTFYQALCEHSVPIRHVERATRSVPSLPGALRHPHPRRPALAERWPTRWPPRTSKEPLQMEETP